MKREIILVGIAFSILLVATASKSVTAQNQSLLKQTVDSAKNIVGGGANVLTNITG